MIDRLQNNFAFLLSKIDIKVVFFVMIFIGTFHYVPREVISHIPLPVFWAARILRELCLFILICFTVYYLIKRNFHIPINKLAVIMGLYVFVCFLSVIVNTDMLADGVIGLTFLLGNFFVFLIMLYTLKDNDHKVLIYAMIALIFLNSILSYLDFAFNFSSKAGTFGDRNFYGRLVVVVITYLMIKSFNTESALKKLLLIFGTLFLLINVTLLLQRGVYLACFFAITAIILATKNKKIIISGMLLSCIIAVVFGFMTIKRMQMHQMDVVNMSDAGRVSAMFAGFNMWKANPILGVGIGTSTLRIREYEDIQIMGISNEKFAIHNIYVQQLAETGLLGFLLINTFSAILLFQLIRRFKGKKNIVKECPYELFYVISMCVYLITGMLYPQTGEGYYWYFSAGAMILLRDTKKGKE